MTDFVLSLWVGVPVLLVTMMLLALWEIRLVRDRRPGLLLSGGAVLSTTALVGLVVFRFVEFV